MAADDFTRATGTTLDVVRRQNLTQVLRLTHRDGPISRAELTRATGLNRSTIGGLVAELEARGLVDETEPHLTRKVGRPSPMVMPSDATVAIAVNPEIDAVDVGVVSLGGRVLRRVRFKNERIPTPTEFVNIVAAIVGGMRPELDDSSRTLGIGLAVPGLVRSKDGQVLLAPHLGWHEAPITAMLAEATGMSVVAGNDASCGVVAESVFGGGRGVDSVVYLNGGASGIGGGVALGGTLLTGAGGYAGEFGHTLVESNGSACHCGAIGCLETEVRRDALLAAVGLDDLAVEKLPAALAAAWSDPESVGAREVRRQVDYLAVALRNILNGLNPRRIVLGGFLATLLGVVGEAGLAARLDVALPGARHDVSIAAATLGRDVLLVGAAELVFGPVLDDPTLMPVLAVPAPVTF
ncbi:MAG TPA: ROK family transcriptional regulator [Microbacterium sp.]|uniref:ROK family transcriptional regulator n=1 Tax=Microbacterium sp. TaxID=51671 RepID=UPI002B5DEB3D|nr:ROK family transcriptional regulator [Microbacterium sp.]HWI30457.1 ROK family transcriptional regulator [Microbacterium sp.]